MPRWCVGVQLLHCLQNAAEGGATTFADGFRVAEALREAGERNHTTSALALPSPVPVPARPSSLRLLSPSRLSGCSEPGGGVDADPVAFRLLAAQPCPFEYLDPTQSVRLTAEVPVIKLGYDGETVERVAFNNR
jgi:hypothetical protein